MERLEVISGPTGRRRWPDAVQARIVAEAPERGARVKEVAARRGGQPRQVTAWRCRIRGGRRAIAAEREAESAVLAIGPPSLQASIRTPLAAPLGIAMGGIVIGLPGDMPAKRVAGIARALRP